MQRILRRLVCAKLEQMQGSKKLAFLSSGSIRSLGFKLPQDKAALIAIIELP
jgi:hypothetical protein